MSRKAFALSINFIVILILALTVLFIGFQFSYRALKKAEEMKIQIDAETESQIESYLAAGERVAIARNKKTIEKGGAVFGLGVLNTNPPGAEIKKDFFVKVCCSYKYDNTGRIVKEGFELCSPLCNNETWIKMVSNSFELNNNEDKKIAILITPKDPTTGLYSFIVTVTRDTEQYGDPQVIYVEVP